MTTTTNQALATMTDSEIEHAPEGSPAATLAAAWWAWHDEDSIRNDGSMASALRRCAAWVRGECDEGPDLTPEHLRDSAICECGQWSGTACEGTLGEDAVTVEYMPDSLRSSHIAAGNHGRYLANGAIRISVTPECAIQMTGTDGEWCSVVAARPLHDSEGHGLADRGVGVGTYSELAHRDEE